MFFDFSNRLPVRRFFELSHASSYSAFIAKVNIIQLYLILTLVEMFLAAGFRAVGVFIYKVTSLALTFTRGFLPNVIKSYYDVHTRNATVH